MDPGTLSISVPNDPLISSTLSGDVLINSDGELQQRVEPSLHRALARGGPRLRHRRQLRSEFTDESAGSGDHPVDRRRHRRPSGPLWVPGTRTRTRGPAATIGSTRRPRSRSRAVPAATPVQLRSSRTATSRRTRTSISTPSRPRMTIRGPVTIRLRSAGISLLNPHLTVLDASGNVLGDVQSTSDFGDVVTLHLDQVDANANYFVEVQGATGDVFGIGSYGVAVTFDSNSTVTTSAIDAVLRGPYPVAESQRHQRDFPRDGESPCSIATTGPIIPRAPRLSSSPRPVTRRNSHYELVGSLSGTDRRRLLSHPDGRQSAQRTDPGAHRHRPCAGRQRRDPASHDPRRQRQLRLAADPRQRRRDVHRPGQRSERRWELCDRGGPEHRDRLSIARGTTPSWPTSATTAAQLTDLASDTLPATTGSTQSFNLYRGREPAHAPDPLGRRGRGRRRSGLRGPDDHAGRVRQRRLQP